MPSDKVVVPNIRRDLAFSGWIDLFRGMAALAVVFSHVRVLFLASMAAGIAIAPVSKMLYFLSGYGHTAVTVFFVLSGFLVGGAAIRLMREGRWSWGRYALQRGTRLYVVLIPALVLTLAWDFAESQRSAGQVPNDDTAKAIISSPEIEENTSTSTFLGNALYLQTISVPSLGSNTPLWSLANEFWYYVLFPLLWLGLSRNSTGLASRLVCLAAAVGIGVFVGKSIALYFSIWLLGCFVWLVPEWPILHRTVWRRLAVALAAAGFLSALLAIRLVRGWSDYPLDLLVGSTFALLLYCMKHSRAHVSVPLVHKGVTSLAGFSYTLYLVHLSPLVFLRACLTYETAWPSGPIAWVEVFVIMLLVCVYAYFVSLLTERHTDRLRRWLEQRIWKRRPVGHEEKSAAKDRIRELAPAVSPA
jgi:peptidoglycan/LPS O-acetylase OafA/YrhL